MNDGTVTSASLTFNPSRRGHLTPFRDFPLPVGWRADWRVAKAKREMLDFIGGWTHIACFGFKHPRTARVFPVSHQSLNELNLAPKPVICLCTPTQGTRPLPAWDGLDSDTGEYRCFICMVEVSRYADRFANLDWLRSVSDLDFAIRGIVDCRLRRDASNHRVASQPLLGSLYKLAKRTVQDNVAWGQAQLIAAQFVGFQQLQNCFQQVFECTAQLAGTLPAVEAKNAARPGALAERDDALLPAELEAAEQPATVAALHSHIDAARAALVEAEFREVEDGAVADALPTEISSARIALSRSEQSYADTWLAMRLEIEELHAAVDDAERRRQQTQEMNTALQAEITSLRNNLAAAHDVGAGALAALRSQHPGVPREPQSVRRSFIWQRLGFRTIDLWTRPFGSIGSKRRQSSSLPAPRPLRGERTGAGVLRAPKPLISPTGRAFVVGAYLPNGGAYMVYHLGRILHLDFGLDIVSVVVGGEAADNGIFHYDVRFPWIGVSAMEHQIADSDILIANPSFSNYFFGPRLPGRKLMYIQGFNTFALLDRYFDLYASVSRFVARFVRTAYGVSAPVIPAFVEVDRLPPVIPWQDRPAASIVVYLKGDPTFKEIMLARLRAAVARRVPGVELDNVLNGSPLSQTDFLSRIGSCRYFVNLSPAEGFGLVPLEAMGMGTTVIGLDGFGGREYMKSGKNCLVTRYPDIEGVAEQLFLALNAPAFAERLAEQGRITTSQFAYARFRAAWRHQLQHFLAGDAAACRT